MSARLSSVLRPGDTLARFGGDEFVIVCEDVPMDEVERLANRAAMTLREPFVFEGNEVNVSASIGIAVSAVDTDAATMLRDADAALYRAKAGGRNRAVVFDEAMHEMAAARLDAEQGLRRALDHRRAPRPLPAGHGCRHRCGRRLRGPRPLGPSGARRPRSSRVRHGRGGDRTDRPPRRVGDDRGPRADSAVAPGAARGSRSVDRGERLAAAAAVPAPARRACPFLSVSGLPPDRGAPGDHRVRPHRRGRTAPGHA